MFIEPQKVVLGFNKDTIFTNIDKNFEFVPMQTYPLNLSLEDIHNQLVDIKFNNFYQGVGGNLNRNSALENAHLIPFNLVYYNLFLQEQKVPTPYKMTCEYILRFCTESKVKKHCYKLSEKYKLLGFSSPTFSVDELAARIGRAYNSFNREIELCFRLFKEKGLNVKYSFKQDYYNGIDLCILKNNQYWGIACYQNSAKAESYKYLKETSRRNNYMFGDMINLAIDAKNHDNCGDIWIYSETEYKRLLEKLCEE